MTRTSGQLNPVQTVRGQGNQDFLDTVNIQKYLLAVFRGLELRFNKITCVKVFTTGSACIRCPEDVPLAPPSFLRSHIT